MRRWILPGLALLASVTGGQEASAPSRPRVTWTRAGVAARYMRVENTARVVTVTQVQHRQDLAGRVRLHSRDRLGLSFWLNSGPSFTAGWNETLIGPRDPTMDIHLKHLFLDWRPRDGVTAQLGGLEFLRGQNSEITSYNNDGFLTGYRIAVRRPSRVVDDLAVTYGYFGDMREPGFQHRADRLSQGNYFQVLLGRSVGNRLDLSLDMTTLGGTPTLRQGVRLREPFNGALQSLRVEAYERSDSGTAGGFAVLGEKQLHPRVGLTAGFTQVDDAYGNLNADKVYQGPHLYLLTTFTIGRGASLVLFHGHHVGSTPSRTLPVKARTEVVLRWNALPALTARR